MKRRAASFFALITALFFAVLLSATSTASPGTNKTINFQGRLLNASGGIVADGYYNMQFKIYQDGSGGSAGNPGGSLKWTETYVNSGSQTGAIQVKNGFFAVALGSVTPFGTSVDWDQDTLWLSMNVAGSSVDCTAFGSGSCGADGEMLPMKRITATPYALNAGALGGKTADNFVQLGQGVQTDASTNTSSIFINKTGTGNLVQLQQAGADIFTIGMTGNLVLGNTSDKTISVDTSETDTEGKNLTLSAGGGGGGAGADGGTLILQGGSAGGTNGDGGGVSIDAGTKTGSGNGGTIAIGETNASTIIIGSTSVNTAQEISIGANNTAGSSTDVIVGSGGDAASGSTTIQAKNSVSIATDGTTKATFDGSTNVVYFGNGVSSTTPNDFTIQGTNSSATAVSGASLTVQGGNATAGNANGGNIVLAGGTGSGSGSNGVVVLTTPTFSTVSNDANCFTGGSLVTTSCTVSEATVNSASAVFIGFSSTGQTATLPDPGNTTAGRIMYIMAAENSKDFTLVVNGGGAGNQFLIRAGSAATLLWNGSNWMNAGGTGASTIQDTYTASVQNSVESELLLNGADAGNGLTIQDNPSNPVNGTLFEVKNSAASPLLSVNSGDANLASNGTVHNDPNFATNWTGVGSASIARIATDGYEAGDSAQVIAGTTAGNGIANKLLASPRANTSYRVSVYAKLVSGSAFTDFKVVYSPDNGTTYIDCTDYNTQTIVDSTWTQVTCTITTDGTAVTTPRVYFAQPTAAVTARSYLVDAFTFTLPASAATNNVQVGGGEGGDKTTLFTVDKSVSAPTVENSESLLGSMYYDITLGKLQCYEANGWGSCGASPDHFVSLSPEYPNAVMNGNDTGVMTSDICSDDLDINDGSSSQPSVCSTHETYNFYNWTSAEATAKTKSIYVTYQLPASFKEFVPGSTTLLGRTDSSDSNVTYQIYRKENANGLTSCGSPIAVSTGAQTAWQTANASSEAEPASCGFKAGDSVVIRINLTAANNANAYISNLNFTFSHL